MIFIKFADPCSPHQVVLGYFHHPERNPPTVRLSLPPPQPGSQPSTFSTELPILDVSSTWSHVGGDPWRLPSSLGTVLEVPPRVAQAQVPRLSTAQRRSILLMGPSCGPRPPPAEGQLTECRGSEEWKYACSRSPAGA